MTVPSQTAADELSERITATTQRLAAEFSGYFTPQAVEDIARQSLERYQHAVVLDFVPLFVERYTRERLKASIGQTRV
jgi:hypothetical protein